ncbi:fatty acyl-AMP ligase [[Mycobacterium] vasticus]|uniref:Fatty acyl-AMP ligase n=1 Tax=[Mycobacterium] vasticus TaxID=2875777 RepID=A0ABU5YS51_9MYCO|nr:fatty acyl-AMP ligase [Mycolicibacter sp. MYC017]MEB3067946.1 fatty acyl-AMP ligase [Mycolicibacter sp. MYC017]
MSDYDLPSETTLVDLLQRRAEQYRDKVAFSFSYNGDDEDRTQLTYGELTLKARAIASYLQQQGAAGERVLVLVRPGLDAVAAFFGCVLAGAVAVPAHQKLAPRLSSVVPDAQARFVLSTADTQANTQAAVDDLTDGQAPRWCVIADAAAADPANWVPPDIEADSVAMIQYTSGSTTEPKGVVLTHRNLLHNLEANRQSWDADDRMICVSWLPPHHDMGLIGVVLVTLYLGATTALMSPAAFIKRPMRWLEAISRERATIATAPNFAYGRCVERSTAAERAALDLSSLTTVHVGAEPVRAATLAAFADAFAPAGFKLEMFMPVYGLAEATVLVSGGSDAAVAGVRYVDRSALAQDRVVDVAPDSPTAAAVVACGRPRQDVVIVDPATSRACGPDEVGEIWVSGPSVGQGYWRRPEETAQTFGGYLAETGEGPFLRTGDMGFLCADELFIIGRCKDLVVVDGRNYYPHDIEFTVQDCNPALVANRGAVFTTSPGPDARAQLVVVQEVDRRGIGDAELGAVMEGIRDAIAQKHLLETHHVMLVAPLSIPTTSSGKIQRGQCRQQFLDGGLTVVADWHAPSQSG